MCFTRLNFKLIRKFRPEGPIAVGNDFVNPARSFSTRIYGQAMSVPTVIVPHGVISFGTQSATPSPDRDRGTSALDEKMDKTVISNK